MKTHVKKGDEVVVISGNAKGKTGKVLAVNASKQQVIVEGARRMTPAVRRSAQHPEGGLMQIDGPIHLSNVKKLG